MIYGLFPASKASSTLDLPFFRFFKAIASEDVKNHEVINGNLNARILTNPITRKSISDCYYEEPDNNTAIIIYGNIYNLTELEGIFSIDTSEPVPKTILQNYLNHGFDLIKQLNGDFIIMIVDSINHNLKVFRDHLGIKSFSYLVQDNTLFFSTDNLNFCRFFHNSGTTINNETLLSNYKFVDFLQSYNKSVNKLPPGHYLEFSNSGLKVYKYWFPERIKTQKKLTRQKILSDLEFLLKKSTESRCDPQYKTAVHLSGGLDSGIVAALARKKYIDQEDFIGYSWSPENSDIDKVAFDEREMVKAQAELNGIKAIYVNPDLKDYREYNLARIHNSGYIEENMVLKDARKKDIRFILSGYGGDEFISKGDRGVDLDLLLSFRLRMFMQRNSLKHPKKLIQKLMNDIILPYLGIIAPSVRKSDKEDTRYIKKEYRTQNKANSKRFFTYKSRTQLHLNFYYCYYLNQRIEEWEAMGAKYGIEYRYPLLDKDIVEYMLKVPSHLLVNGPWSRTILREISEGILPENIRWRKSGQDPVLNKSVDDKVKLCSKSYISEFEEMKNNPDLQFYNFTKIGYDLKKFKRTGDDSKFRNLLYVIFNMKGFHEFSKAYHKK